MASARKKFSDQLIADVHSDAVMKLGTHKEIAKRYKLTKSQVEYILYKKRPKLLIPVEAFNNKDDKDTRSKAGDAYNSLLSPPAPPQSFFGKLWQSVKDMLGLA